MPTLNRLAGGLLTLMLVAGVGSPTGQWFAHQLTPCAQAARLCR